MDIQGIVKNSQEQAVAAWVGTLNEFRCAELLNKLLAQNISLEKALQELDRAKLDIANLVMSNRGGDKGMHGFLAEAAEVGIENAKRLVNGLPAICKWINDNGPADLYRACTPIQQKFVRADLGISAIVEHLKKYPEFTIVDGGVYQLPRDFYEKIVKLANMTKEEAGRLVANDPSGLTYKNWLKVQELFEEHPVGLCNLEPAEFDYADAQRDRIYRTLEKEEASVRETDQARREQAYEDSAPTVKQGVQAAAVSAAVEGGVSFCLGVAQKLKSGKKLNEFTAKDWEDLGFDTASGAVKGGIRGGAVYALTNFTATPAAVANSLVTAAYGVVGQAMQLRQGNISEEDFLVNSQAVCLDVSISAIASVMGTALIPIPVLGAVIGNAVGMFVYGLTKDVLSEKEQGLIKSYRQELEELNRQLDEKLLEVIRRLQAEFEKFSSILELAFDLDVNVAFAGSIQLAVYTGVEPNRVLKNADEIDAFFMD